MHNYYNIQNCQMIPQKHMQNHLSAERILKSKYLDREKQKTVPLLNKRQKRITLIDLCPEQKLKVGQLIKTLEARKQENERLTQQIDQITQKYEECQSKLMHLSQAFQTKQHELEELMSKIQLFEQKYKEQCKVNNKLTTERDALQDALQSISSIKTQSKTVQTETIPTSNILIQTKKIKTKSQSIQASIEEEQETRRGIFYHQHSKSFQKIMKGNSINLERNSICQYNGHSTEKYSNLKENDPEYIRQSSPKEVSNSEEISQCNDSLTKKWQELKNKNMKQTNISKQLKHKYYESHSSCSSPQQFAEGEQNIIAKKESSIDNLDQVELNKLLKTKNFSASKLISSRGVLTEGQILIHPPKFQKQVKYIKKPYFQTSPNIISQDHLSIPKSKQGKKSSTSSPNGINFYESDLLELADSIQP